MRRGPGLGLALFLIAALIAAFLAVRQMSSMPGAAGGEDEQTAVESAQSAVDSINQRNTDILEQIE